MIEIKFLKELPCRYVNNNKNVIDLRGADMYIDKDGNRFVYVAFTNNYRKPFFSLYFYVKEYDASGCLIKEDKYAVPHAYGEQGMYVIEEPFFVEKDCDAIDVYVSLAEYGSMVFYNDRLSRNGDIRVGNKFYAPKTAEEGFTGSRKEASPIPTINNAINEKKVAVEAPDEEPTPVVQAEAPVVEKQEVSLSNKNVRRYGKMFNFGPILAAIVCIVVIIIVGFTCQELASYDAAMYLFNDNYPRFLLKAIKLFIK